MHSTIDLSADFIRHAGTTNLLGTLARSNPKPNEANVALTVDSIFELLVCVSSAADGLVNGRFCTC